MNDNPEQSLFSASYTGRFDVVQELLTSGAITDINRRNCLFQNWSTLHYISAVGNTTILQMLLDRQADVNIINNHERTPLHLAVCYGHTQTLAVLLAHPQVNLNATDMDSETPLYSAASGGRRDCVQLLLDAQADPIFRNRVLYLYVLVGKYDSND